MAAGGLAITLGLLLACVFFFRDALLQEFWYPKLPPHIDRVLWWLPEDTQTLIVAQGPFSIPAGKGGESSRDVREAFLELSLGALSETQDGAFPEPITNRKVSLWVEGSKEFRSPQGLGLTPYKGCGIVVFEDDLGEAGGALMASVCHAFYV